MILHSRGARERQGKVNGSLPKQFMFGPHSQASEFPRSKAKVTPKRMSQPQPTCSHLYRVSI